MYSQIDIEIINKNDDINKESYEFIYNTSNYICNDLKKNLLNNDLDLYYMKKNTILDNNKIFYNNTDYIISISINRYIGNEIRFLKNSNKYKFNINIIKYIDPENNINNIIGISYNNNNYYIYNQNNTLDCYKIKDIDKSIISELIRDSFLYYFNYKCRYDNNINNFELLKSYNNYYKKRYNNINQNIIPYMKLYQSSLLKFEILYNNEEKGYTFLPINKNSTSNLFNKYQMLFKMLHCNDNIKTFNNPKNEIFFNNNYYIKKTDFKFKLRLYCSKENIYNSLYYRKTTEKNIYNINLLLYNNTNKIIGIEFNNTKYYIWKNNGNLNTYDTFNENNNYHDLISNTFKDALVFYFKIN